MDNQLLNLDKVTQALLENDGDLALTAERLLGNKLAQDQLLAAITSEPESVNAFAAKARAYMILKTISMFSATHTVAMSQIHELTAKQAAQYALDIATIIEKLTVAPKATNNTTVNVFETILRTLPPQVGDAIKELIAIDPSGQVISRTALPPSSGDAQELAS